jgi:hypothetical protein
MNLRPLLFASMFSALLGAALSNTACCAGGAELPGGGKTAQVLRFRRVYAPADRVEDWPRGDVKYMRMEPAEFDRLLKAAQSTTSRDQAFLAARIVAAQYQAELDGDQLTAGRGTLQVVQSAGARTLLPLDPCGLAIGKAHWAGDKPRGATLGLGVDATLQVLTEGSGQLEFQWSLAGQHDAEDVLNFRFELPASPANRLILDLPEKMTPAADQGLVFQAGWADEGLRRWQIELGGHHRFRLRVLPASAAQRPRQLPLVRESVKYHFSPHGVDVTADLTFEVHNGPLRQVTLALDPQLQLASAQCGDTTVPWVPVSTGSSPVTQIALTLPEVGHDTQPVLRLRALAPLATDRRWRLPRIRPEGVLWQEGTATLLVLAPLSIEGLLPIGCRQTGTGPLSGSRVGEAAEFQYLTPDATVEILLSRRHTPLRMASGTAIELSDRGMTARVVADFHVSQDPRFVLEADVSRRWLIDSVESFPVETVDDWDLERPNGGRRKLTVHLAQSLSPTRPLRLIVNARRLRSPLGWQLAIDDLVPLRFQAPEQSPRLVAVRALGPFRLRLTGAEQLHRVNPHSLDAAERGLFAKLPDDLLFENDLDAAGLKISLESRPPGYAVRLGAEALVGEETLRETYSLRCVPESSQVERLLVFFSQRRKVPLRWTLGAESDQQVSARQWSLQQQTAAGLTAQQEAWELTLRRPRREAFEIRGTREVKLEDQQPISLVSLPEARSQQATLVVRSPDFTGIRIINRRLTAIPAETVAPDRYQTARATYRYDPSRDVVGLPEAAITVSRSGDTLTPPVWVCSGHLESQYEVSGAGRHLATYRLQNSGANVLRLDLPSGVKPADVQGVWVDEHRAAVSQPAGGRADRLVIDLPQGEKFPTISLLLSTPASRLRTIGSLSAPLPKVDVPVLAQSWSVWLPPGYEAYGPQLRRQPSAPARLTWSQRLFGPLGRAAGQRTFDPLEATARLFAPAKTADSPPSPMETPQGPPREPGSPWSHAQLAEVQPADSHGWNTYRLELAGASAGRLTFVHRPTLLLLGAVTFLLAVAIGWWMAGDRPKVLSVLAGGFGCAALLLPEAYVPIASGGVLATLFCLAYGLLRSRRGTRQSPADSTAGPGSPRAASAAALLGIVGFVATHGISATARGEQPELRLPVPVHRVFIPVDQNEQPTGDRYYVPEEIYHQLLRGGAAATDKPYGWLIKAATYRGALSRETASQRLVVEELRASFALQVFDAAARVRIPFGREGANLLPGGVLLDGRPIQPEWETDGSALLFEVPQPGEYHLELPLRPTVRTDGAMAGFDLAIPPLATSQLELSLPPGAPAVEVPSALGVAQLAEDPPRRVAELGPSNRLTVRWPEGAARAATASAVDLEELLWMKVQPGSVVVDAKLKFNVAEGQLRQVRLVADPRLRLLPLEGDNPPAVEIHSVPGQPQILLFRWPNPTSDPVVLRATFYLTGTSGVGNLRLPQLKALDARSTRRWLAVSVDPALEHEEQVSGGIEAVAVPDFLSSWGQSDSHPLFAYRLSPDETTWSMATRLCEPRTTVTQKLTLSFDLGSVAVQFDAKLVPAAGYIFQHRLLAPAGLQVEKVSILEDGVARDLRWSQDQQGTVTVFLPELMAGRQKLSLRGRLPVRDGTMQLPVLQIDRGQLQSSTIELFRRPAVLVQLSQPVGLQPLEQPAAIADYPEWGRLVGRFRAQGEEPVQAALTLTPNRPKVRAEQLTRLRCHGGSWTAQLDFRIHVSGGVMDQIRIDVPGPLSGPYQVSPAETLEVISLPSVAYGANAAEWAAQQRQLVVRPAAAIKADYQFSISSPLSFGPGERPHAPQVALPQASPLEQFLALPQQVDGRPADWRRQDLKAAELPEGFVAPPDAEAFATYQVVGKASRAILSRSRSRQDARVRLADVHIAWRADRSCVGVATFDLEPGSLSECRLRLPSSCRLLHVSVAGVPTEPVPSGPASADSSLWRVRLGPARLPQRIEVLFTGELPEAPSAATRSFDAPTLDELPVEQTLWTVVGPPAFGPGQPQENSPSSPWSHELAHLNSAAAMIESGATVPAKDPDETLRWYSRWAGRLAASQTVLQRLSAQGRLANSALEEIDAIDQQQWQIAERLGVADVYQRLKREGLSVADLPSPGHLDAAPNGWAGLWEQSLHSEQSPTRCTVPARSGSITLSYRQTQAGGLPSRLAGAIGLAAVIILVVLGLRRGTLAECLKRWPQAVGVAAGLAWWLWLSPSILGWGIVLLSLAALLRPGWTYSPPAPGSSVISLRTGQR